MTTGVPGRGRPSVVPAVAIAGAVVLVELALVVGWVVFLTVDDGWSRVVWGAVGALVLWRLVPRPVPLSGRTRVLRADEAPTLHRLVDEVAVRVGARPPETVAVDTTYPVALVPLGYRGRATLVVGLPQWTALDPAERLAVLAHELACAEPRRGLAGRVVALADDLLTSVATILTPTEVVTADQLAIQQTTSTMGYYGPADELAANARAREASAAVGAAGMELVGAPARAVRRLLARSWRPVLEAAALRADRLAAGLAGRQATTAAVLSFVGVPRGLSAAQNAARERGGDPWAALAAAPRPDAGETERRLAAEPPDAVAPGHPPTRRRLEEVGDADTTPSSGGTVDPALVRAADAELEPIRAALRARFAEELLHGRP